MRTAARIVRKIIKLTDSLVNMTVLVIILLLVAVAAYAMWDSGLVYSAADATQYAIYKPGEEDSISFSQMQEINPEVIAWLTIYGTSIDYPVTQGTDNMKYVNTNAQGEYSLAGSIFLDHINDPLFQDFNSILYGHHMEKQAMFGEIEAFGDKNFFDSHRYGSLYYAGKEHGLEIYAFLQTDAYDAGVFTPRMQGQDARREYLRNLLEKSAHIRSIEVTAEDHILLLTTCSPSSTNGRDILVAKITDELYDDLFIAEATSDKAEQVSVDQQPSLWGRIPGWLKILFPVLLILLAAVTVYIVRRKRKR